MNDEVIRKVRTRHIYILHFVAIKKIIKRLLISSASLFIRFYPLECHGEKEIDIQSDDASGYYKEIHNRLLTDKKTYQKYLELILCSKHPL